MTNETNKAIEDEEAAEREFMQALRAPIMDFFRRQKPPSYAPTNPNAKAIEALEKVKSWMYKKLAPTDRLDNTITAEDLRNEINRMITELREESK